ncbi:MAG: peptidase M23 [Ornithinimicrobium sp.]
MVPPIALASSSEGKPLGTPSPLGPKAKKFGDASSRPQVARASLTVYDAEAAKSGTGAKVGAERAEEAIEFQFNPKEVTIAKAAKWERDTSKKAKKAGLPEFKGAEPCKLTLEMFFDATATHDGSVVAAVERLFSCCTPTEESASKDKPTPPLVMLKWGAISSFPAFVTSVSAKYTLFSAEGMPIRAVCSVSLEEMPDEAWRQNPTSGGLSARRAHQVIDGDTLAAIAYTEYGDPARWRDVAAYNGIDDPLRVPPGTTLLLPAPEDLDG